MTELLPLDRAKIKRIAVIGPNANSVPMLQGNYNGTASHPVTILNGIEQVAGPGIQVTYTPGCPVALRKDGSNKPSQQETDDAVAAAQSADVVVFVGGISSRFEGEEMRRANVYDGFAGGDRTRIELPSVQTDLLKALAATHKPVIFVNCSGSAIAMPWEAKKLPAIVQAWYPGEQGGRAVAEVLFGDVNPSGHLPVTFYASTGDLPDFTDYSMSNRTYRYFNGRPEFAFGYGLSYTRFKFHDGQLDSKSIPGTGVVKVSFTVENTGGREGDEVAQVYFRHVDSDVAQPKLALCGYVRVPLNRRTIRACYGGNPRRTAAILGYGQKRIRGGAGKISISHRPGLERHPGEVTLHDQRSLRTISLGTDGDGQYMTGNRAGRNVAYGADRISPSGGTSRKHTVFEIGFEIGSRGDIASTFPVFQSPLFFCRVNLPEIIDAGILHRNVARLDEIRHGDGEHQGNHNDGPGHSEITRHQARDGQPLPGKRACGPLYF